MKVTPIFNEGAYLAINAIPNLCAVVDAPGCESQRGQKIGVWNDQYSDLTGDGSYSRNRRLLSADWQNFAEIRGPEEELERAIRMAAERHPGKPILLLKALLSLVINTDIDGIALSLRDEIDNPIVVIHHGTMDDDWIDGYRKVNTAILDLMMNPAGENRPVVSGFPLLRNEGDELGNVMELKRLWRALKLPEPAWLFSGKALHFASIHPDSPRIVFPFDSDFDSSGPASGRIPVDLPIGFENTTSFLKSIAGHFDRADAATKLIDEEHQRLAEKLQPVITRGLAGRGAGVIGDPWRASGLWKVLRELGMDVPFVVALRKDGEPVADHRMMERKGTAVYQDPEFDDIRELLIRDRKADLIDVVVGSGAFMDAARSAGLPYVETGFPCYIQHFAASNPIMGFEGILRMAERVDNAIASNR